MSQDETGKTHEREQEDLQERHNHTLKGEADNVGIRPTNAAQGKTEQIKKDKEHDEDISFLVHLQQLGEISEQMSELFEQAQASLERLNKLNALRNDFDLRKFQTLMMEEYGEDVSHLTEDAAKARLDEMFEREKLTFETLVEELEKKAEEFENKACGLEKSGDEYRKLHQGILRQINELKAQASRDGILEHEIDEAAQISFKNPGSSNLIEDSDQQSQNDYYSKIETAITKWEFGDLNVSEEERVQYAKMINEMNERICDGPDLSKEELVKFRDRMNYIARRMVDDPNPSKEERAQYDNWLDDLEQIQSRIQEKTGINIAHFVDPSEVNSQRSTSSFAGPVENDPFAEVACLSEPFNEVADQTECTEPSKDKILTTEKEPVISKGSDPVIPKC